MPELLSVLYKWSSDEAVFKMAKSITMSDDVKNYYKGHINHGAWEISLKGEMIRKGIFEEKDSAKYLLNFVEDIRKKGIDSVDLGPLKAAAAGAIVEKYSEATLFSLVSDYEGQFEKEPRDPKGFLTERHNILRQRIGTLKKNLKNKERERAKESKNAGRKTGR